MFALSIPLMPLIAAEFAVEIASQISIWRLASASLFNHGCSGLTRDL